MGMLHYVALIFGQDGASLHALPTPPPPPDHQQLRDINELRDLSIVDTRGEKPLPGFCT